MATDVYLQVFYILVFFLMVVLIVFALVKLAWKFYGNKKKVRMNVIQQQKNYIIYAVVKIQEYGGIKALSIKRLYISMMM